MRKKILSAIVFGLLVTAKPVCAATESFNYFQVVMIQPSNDDPDPEYSFPHRTPDGVQGAYFCNENMLSLYVGPETTVNTVKIYKDDHLVIDETNLSVTGDFIEYALASSGLYTVLVYTSDGDVYMSQYTL